MLRSAAAGLLAALALLCAGNSLASDPAQPSVSEGAAPTDTAEPAASDAAAQPAAEAEGAAEATQTETTSSGAQPAETSLEEAAAQAQNVQIEQGKPFDPTKASRKELDAFNADREPDQKIKCVQTYPTGSRRPTKVCMTQSQWKQWQKANQ